MLPLWNLAKRQQSNFANTVRRVLQEDVPNVQMTARELARISEQHNPRPHIPTSQAEIAKQYPNTVDSKEMADTEKKLRYSGPY